MSAYDSANQAILDFMNDDPLIVQYQQFKSGSYDPTTSVNTSTIVSTNCKALILDLTRNVNGLSTKYGQMILEGDKDCYIYPPALLNSLQPQFVIDTAVDKVLIGTILYRVVNMKELNPSGSSALLYNIMLRR